MKPLRLIKSPLNGLIILGQLHENGPYLDIRIAESIGKFFNCKAPHPFGRNVHYQESLGSPTSKWHVDYGTRYMFTMCLTGPGTEFIAKPNCVKEYVYYNDEDIISKGDKVYPRYNFPNGTLLLVDNKWVAHRVPPWLRQTRYVYRWGFTDEEGAKITQQLIIMGLSS